MSKPIPRRWPLYALFLKGNADPIALFYEPAWARQCGGIIWGWDNIVVGLWATPQDREYTMRLVTARQPETREET